jgi:hypothetical protein
MSLQTGISTDFLVSLIIEDVIPESAGESSEKIYKVLPVRIFLMT